MTDAAARWRIVTVAELGAPVRLAALAESIFGARNRPSGWFARKLKRECVDPRLSSLALTADRDPTDPTSWLGYVLVGTPSSLGGAARTAGTGVLASARRRGIASALIEAAADNVRNVGKTQLQLLAERTSGSLQMGDPGALQVLDAAALFAELLHRRTLQRDVHQFVVLS